MQRLAAMSAPRPEMLSLRRTRLAIRRRSPFVALGLPALLGCISALLLNWGGSTARGFLGSAAVLLAAPTALFAGAPVLGGSTRYLVVALTSLLVWLLIGFWAGARSTRNPICDWRDYWREYAALVIPMWVGVIVAYGVTEKYLL
jgi:hypothetical protein